MKSDYDYEFPMTLKHIVKLFQENHLRLTNLKTERQAVYMASKLSGIYVDWPKNRLAPLFPLLLAIEKKLASGGDMEARANAIIHTHSKPFKKDKKRSKRIAIAMSKGK